MHNHQSNKLVLQWDDQLQVRAAEWSEGCYWGHQNMGYGENLAYFYSSAGKMSSIDVIINSCQSWWNETFEWNWSTDCGVACHYTQMIWASTDKIGCALSHCPTLKTDAKSIINAMFFVCFYNPPGNYVGSYPYTKGKNCEQCGVNSKCSAGLCVSTQ
ncbi:hypothetical protein ACJMK2_040669 [Sinanodonta woodiana]|uniref:SCP domain-containing protein n=1 Tax=Sinanodonta woodiana TaxID=1069815 RepID=A0ABD3W513_SINWO